MRNWQWIALGLIMGSQHVAAQAPPPDPIPGTSIAQRPQLAGTIVDQMSTSFSYTVFNTHGGEPTYAVSGSLLSQVVKSIDGSHDFYWSISVAEGRVGNFRVGDGSSFGASATGGWRSDLGGTVAPLALNSNGFSFEYFEPGDFDFVTRGVLNAGTQSRFLLFDTDATAYAKNTTFEMSTTEGSLGRGFGASEPAITFGPAGGGICPRPVSVLSRLFG